MNYISINNHQTIPVSSIPVMNYDTFLELNTSMIQDHPERHCVLYFGYRVGTYVRLICCIADDELHTIMVSSSQVAVDSVLYSFSARHLSFEKFEREIYENFGIDYSDHPWLKPVRYSQNRNEKTGRIADYP